MSIGQKLILKQFKEKKNIYIYTENNKSVHQSIINIKIVKVKVKSINPIELFKPHIEKMCN